MGLGLGLGLAGPRGLLNHKQTSVERNELASCTKGPSSPNLVSCNEEPRKEHVMAKSSPIVPRYVPSIGYFDRFMEVPSSHGM